MTNKEILKSLNIIKKQDSDNTLFYAWELLDKTIQYHFISWCKKYMQVDHKDCFGGWEFGFSKYHEPYIRYLGNTKKFLKEIGY